jgi:hypothetical protein
MDRLKRLPVGIQSFEKLITTDCLYVDKTQQMYDLINRGSVYFLSRPRRFGKSLLLSTFKAIFEGKRDLFKGLAIDKTDFEWKKYPVILLTMPGLSQSDGTHELREKIRDDLRRVVEFHDIDIDMNRPIESIFKNIISQLTEDNKQVVVLVDEYDKPMLDVLVDSDRVQEVRQELHSFYGILKELDERIRFLFFTGVSRFSRTSIFSGLNQLQDISLSGQAHDICGYTDKEMDCYFKQYYDRIIHRDADQSTRELLRIWYDGYQFHQEGAHVYNPFSVLNALDLKEIRNYWFASGTPSFLISLLKEDKFDLISLNELMISDRQMSDIMIERPKFMTVLYQTGYLTLKGFDWASNMYELRVPNQEVRTSLFDCLLESYTDLDVYTNVRPLTISVRKALFAHDIRLVIDHLKTVFAKIPYDINIPLERYYQTILYTIILLSGCDIIVEEATNDGRIDAVLTTPTHRYIIECKMDKSAEEALDQIKEKQYAKKYADDKRHIVLMGINFDSKKRTIVDWIVE